MKECTREQLNSILEEKGIRMGVFQVGLTAMYFAVRGSGIDVYVADEMGLKKRYATETDEEGTIQAFIYDSVRYTHIETAKHNAVMQDFHDDLERTEEAIMHLALQNLELYEGEAVDAHKQQHFF